MKSPFKTLELLPTLLAASIALAATPARAEQTLPDVTTWARRTQALDQLNASVTVMDRAAILATQALDALELLKRVPGIDVSRTGGPGSATSVFMRGTNSNHTLVLIDGVRVSSANTGAYAFEQLPVEFIERIEIVRGPRAALWGSDAIGGVIQIFTHRPEQTSADISAGSFNAFRTTVSTGAGDDALNGGVSVTRRGMQGFSAQNPNGFDFNADNDASYATRLSAVAQAKPRENLRFNASALRSDTDVEFDQGRSTLSDRTVSLRANHQLSERSTQEFRFGYTHQLLETPVYFSRFDSSRIQGDYQRDWQLTQSHITTGLQLQQERGKGAGADGVRDERQSASAFVSVFHPVAMHDLEAALRIDDYSGFGLHASTSAAWGMQLNQQVRSYLSFGQGFRAPNFNELFSPGFGGQFQGDRNLRPERSNSFEAGITVELASNTNLQASLHRTRVSNLISFSRGSDFQAENISRAAIDGFELSVDQRVGSCAWQADMTLQDPRNVARNTPLLRRPKRKAHAGASCELPSHWQVSVDGFANSSRADFGASLPGYGTLDLGISYELNKRLTLALKAENMTDKFYELASGFNTPGRNIMLSVHWQ